MWRLAYLCVMLAGLASGEEEYNFWEATRLGDVTAMQNILDDVPDLDLDYHDDNGHTPLLLAILGHHAAAAQFLLSKSADVETKGRWPGPEDGPLAVAAGLGYLELMDVLLSSGANAGAENGPDRRTPLMVAAAAGQINAVELLLGVGVFVDTVRGDGTTAACWAARFGHGDILQLLLDNGADVNHVDTLDGSSLLHFAAQAPNGETAKIALEAGATYFARTNVMAPKERPRDIDDEMTTLTPGDVDNNDRYEPTRKELKGGLTPIMSAAANAAVEALQVLLDHAKKSAPSTDAFRERMVDAVDVSGLSALAWAASTPLGSQSVESMKLLYEFGARDDTFTIDGRALLHVAATGKNAHALAFLIDIKQHPVDMLSLNKEHTPLFIASFHGSNACAKALLRRGANINAAAFNGATPLIAAASGVQKGVAKLLLKEGANALAMLNDGKFPSQVVPKTPNGRMLKLSLFHAERKAWRKLESHNKVLITQEPPELDDIVIDESLVEDLAADGDSEVGAHENIDVDEAHKTGKEL